MIFVIPVNPQDQAVWIAWELKRRGVRVFLNPVYRNQPRHLRQPYYMLRVLMNAFHHRPRVVFSMELLQGFMGVIINRLFGARTVLYLIDDTLQLRLTRQRALSGPIQVLLSWLQRFTIRHTDLILTIDEIQTAWAHQEGAKKVVTIPYGVNIARFEAADGTPLRQKRIPDGASVFGYVGGFAPHHGAHLIMDAARQFLRLHPGVQFWLIGPSDHVREGSLPEGIFLEGSVSPHQVPAYIKAMDVCICPPITQNLRVSLVTNKLLEYAACGKPIVATRTGAIPHLHATWDFGLLCEPTVEDLMAALEKMLALKASWPRMGMNASKMVKARYDWNINKNRIIRYLLDTLSIA